MAAKPKANRQRGTGSIRAKHDGHEIRISVGRGPDGRYRQASRYIPGTRKDAEAALLRLRLEYGDASNVNADTATLTDLLTAWLSMARRELSPSTVAAYESYITNHIEPRLGKTLVRKLNAATLDRLYRDLLDGAAGRRPLAPRSVRQVHAIIRRALHQAERWGWAQRNVAELASPPGADRADITPPAAADIAALLDQLRTVDEDLADLLWLAATTGARRGELVGVQWDDIAFDAGTLTIRRSVVLDGARQLHVRPKPKGRRARTIRLDADTLDMLSARQLRRKKDLFAEGGRIGPWVWPSARDEAQPLDPTLVTGRYRRAARRAGLATRLHDIRHMVATIALDAGVPITAVSERLGHSQTSTTVNVYSHAVEARDREMADLLGAAIARKA